MNFKDTAQYEKIAEGLAGPGYAVVDDFLTTGEVSSLLQLDEFRKGLLLFKRAGLGQERQINESMRGDYIHWIDTRTPGEEIGAYLQRLSALMTYLNQTLFLSLKDYQVHLTIYPPGSFYKRHIDQFKLNDHRRLSVICYLNEKWEDQHGGQLRLYTQEGTTDVFPRAGSLVCFRSDQLEHEVRPATRSRLSLTGWMLDQLAELSHL